MAGWSNLKTWIVGEVLTAVDVNKYLGDNLTYLKGRAGAVTLEDSLTVTGSLAVTGTITAGGSLASPQYRGSTFPASPADGQLFMLERGNTTMLFMYDASNNAWFSDVFHVPVIYAQVDQTDITTPTLLVSSPAGPVIDGTDLQAAGCSLELRALAHLGPSSGKSARLQLGLDGAGAIAGTEVVGSSTALFGGSWALVAPSGLQRILAYGYRDSGGSGITVSFFNITAQYRWVK